MHFKCVCVCAFVCVLRNLVHCSDTKTQETTGQSQQTRVVSTSALWCGIFHTLLFSLAVFSLWCLQPFLKQCLIVYLKAQTSGRENTLYVSSAHAMCRVRERTTEKWQRVNGKEKRVEVCVLFMWQCRRLQYSSVSTPSLLCRFPADRNVNVVTPEAQPRPFCVVEVLDRSRV